MKAKGTLALAAIFVALCAAYWAMLRFERQGRDEAFEAKRLFKFAARDVVAIDVRRVGEPLVSGSRKPGAVWTISKPHSSIEPNQIVWDRMADAIANLINNRTIEQAPADLAPYGLDKPVLAVDAQTVDGTPVSLRFGSIEATQTFRYALTGGGPVFLIDNRQFVELDRSLDMLRFPYVVNIGKEGVRRIEYARFWTGPAKDDTTPRSDLKAGDESVVVAVDRQAEGSWRMVSPFTAEADTEMVEALVKEVQFATGRNYVDDPKNLADYGLDPPKARITLYSGNQSPQTLLLGALESNDPKTGGGVFAKNADKPSVFVVSPQILALLPRTPEAFRQRRLLTSSAGDITSIHYVSGTADFVLAQDEKVGWTVAEPPIEDPDQVAVSNFLAFLKALQGDSFPGEPKPEFGLDQPFISLTINFKSGAPPKRILVGAEVPDTGQRYAVQDNGVVTILSQLAVRGLTKTIQDFRKLTLLEFSREDVARLAIDIDSARYVFERPRGQWIVAEPENHAITSASDIDALLRMLSGLRAAEVETSAVPADLTPFGLDKPVAIVTITVSPPGGTAKTVGPLKIGAVSPANSQERYASVEQIAGVYRVRQAVVDDIRESLKGIQAQP